MPHRFTPNTPFARVITTPWNYGWNVVGATIVFQSIVFGLLIYSFTFWVEPWSKEFGASRGELMVAITAFNIMMAVCGPFFGRAMDHFPVRRFVILGAFFCGGGFIALSQVNAVWQIVVIFMFIMAVTVGLSGPLAAQTLVTRWFVNRRGRALGISALGTSIGGFIIPIVTTSLIAAYGWREACFILGVSAFVILLPVAWAVVDEPKGSKGQAPSPADETSPEAVEAMAAASDMTAAETLAADRDWRVMEVLREPSFWLLIAACLPLIVCFNAIQYNLGPLMQDLGIPAQRGSLIVSAMAVSMIFGKLLFGHQADIRPHRYLVALMGLGFVFCGFAFMQASSFLSLLPAAIIMGFATGGFMPLIATIIGTRFGARSFGRVSGLTGPVMAVGSFGPLLAGWMRDVSGSYQPVFVMVVCLAAVAAVIGLFLPDRVREQSPS